MKIIRSGKPSIFIEFMHGFLLIFKLELIQIIYAQIKSEMHRKIFAICS